jgi:hypothetical protein
MGQFVGQQMPPIGTGRKLATVENDLPAEREGARVEALRQRRGRRIRVDADGTEIVTEATLEERALLWRQRGTGA